MEFIQTDFSNRQSSLFNTESLQNISNINNANEKSKITNNTPVNLVGNNINEIYNKSNIYNSNPKVILQNNEKGTKFNTITTSPLLQLASHPKKEFDVSKEPYKLSPSTSVSSIMDYNVSLPSSLPVINEAIDPQQINISKPTTLSINTPVLSSENLNELISFSTTKCQFPYTPSSSLSFVSSTGFGKTKLNSNINDEINNYLNIKEVESPINENQNQNQPLKSTSGLLKNIYNMEIYGPTTTTLNDYSIINNPEDKKDTDVNKVDTSILSSIDTYIDYTNINISTEDNNNDIKMDSVETQKDQKKKDENHLSKEKELHDEIKKDSEDKKETELNKSNSSIMEVEYEHESQVAKEDNHNKIENNKNNGSHINDNESNEHVMKAKKKDQIDIILGKKIKKLIKKKNEEELKKKIKHEKREISVLSENTKPVETNTTTTMVSENNTNDNKDNNSHDVSKSNDKINESNETTLETIKDDTQIHFENNTPMDGEQSTSSSSHIQLKLHRRPRQSQNSIKIHKTPLKYPAYVMVNNKPGNYVFKKNPNYNKSKDDLKLRMDYPQNIYGQAFNYSSSPQPMLSNINMNNNLLAESSQYNNQIQYNMSMGYNIPTSVTSLENTTMTTSLNPSQPIDLSQNLYSQMNPNVMIQPVAYSLPPQETNIEGSDEDTEKKEEIPEEHEDSKKEVQAHKDERLSGNKKTLHKKIKLRVQKKEKLEKLKQELKNDSSSNAVSCDYSEYPQLTPKTEKKNIKFNIKKRLKLRINHQNVDDDMNGIENESPSKKVTEMPIEKSTTNVTVDSTTENVNITPMMNPITTTYMTPASSAQSFIINSGNIQNNLLTGYMLNSNTTNMENEILYYQKQGTTQPLEQSSQSSGSYNLSLLQLQNQTQQQQSLTQPPAQTQLSATPQINPLQPQRNPQLQSTTYSFNPQLQAGIQNRIEIQGQYQPSLGLQIPSQYQQPISTQNEIQGQLPVQTIAPIPIQTVIKTDTSPQIQMSLPQQSLTQIPIQTTMMTTDNTTSEIKNEEINLLSSSSQQQNQNSIKLNATKDIKVNTDSQSSPMDQSSQTAVLSSSLKTEKSLQSTNKSELNESSSSTLLNIPIPDIMNIDISKMTDIDIPIDIPELNEATDEILSSLISSSETTSTNTTTIDATATTNTDTTPVELPNLNMVNPIPINVMNGSNNSNNNVMLNVSPVTNPTTPIINMNTSVSTTIPPSNTNITRNIINTSATTAINTNSLNTTPAAAINTNPLNPTANASNILGLVVSEGLMNYNMYAYNTGYPSSTSTVTATTPLPNYPPANTMTTLVNTSTNSNTTPPTMMNTNYMNPMPNYSMYPMNYPNYNVAPAVPDYVNFKALPHVKFEKIQKPKKVYYKKPKIYNTKKRGRQ